MDMIKGLLQNKQFVNDLKTFNISPPQIKFTIEILEKKFRGETEELALDLLLDIQKTLTQTDGNQKIVAPLLDFCEENIAKLANIDFEYEFTKESYFLWSQWTGTGALERSGREVSCVGSKYDILAPCSYVANLLDGAVYNLDSDYLKRDLKSNFKNLPEDFDPYQMCLTLYDKHVMRVIKDRRRSVEKNIIDKIEDIFYFFTELLYEDGVVELSFCNYEDTVERLKKELSDYLLKNHEVSVYDLPQSLALTSLMINEYECYYW